jgi:hypothetical protein
MPKITQEITTIQRTSVTIGFCMTLLALEVIKIEQGLVFRIIPFLVMSKLSSVLSK